jgi:hypothetical protein
MVIFRNPGELERSLSFALVGFGVSNWFPSSRDNTRVGESLAPVGAVPRFAEYREE